MASHRKHVRELEQYAKDLGFDMSYTAKHLRFTKPGCKDVIASKTPDCSHAIKNAQADLRRAARSIAA